MLGQSGFLAFMGSNIVKRVSYLGYRLVGENRADADIKSDEIAITTATGIGGALSIATVDPLGGGATVAYVALLENDLAQKRAEKERSRG